MECIPSTPPIIARSLPDQPRPATSALAPADLPVSLPRPRPAPRPRSRGRVSRGRGSCAPPCEWRAGCSSCRLLSDQGFVAGSDERLAFDRQTVAELAQHIMQAGDEWLIPFVAHDHGTNRGMVAHEVHQLPPADVELPLGLGVVLRGLRFP